MAEEANILWTKAHIGIRKLNCRKLVEYREINGQDNISYILICDVVAGISIDIYKIFNMINGKVNE